MRAEKLGPNAFPHGGRAHYYSGPIRDIQDQLLPRALDNHERAIIWAKKHSASLIENFPLGRFLDKFNGVGTFDYYLDFDEAIRPWKELSRLYALSIWGCVSTTVCGANTYGVYNTIEITNTVNPHHSDVVFPTVFDKTFYDNLLNAREFFELRRCFNPDRKPVEYINLRPFDEFENLYDPFNTLPVHRYACLTEQRMALHEALRAADRPTIRNALNAASREVFSRPVEAYEYYLDSRERFDLDWKNMMGSRRPASFVMTPTERAEDKETKLITFGLMVWDLIQTELKMMPATTRPAMDIPAVLLRSGIAP